MFVDFENIDVFQTRFLLFPIAGEDVGFFDPAQKPLYIERYKTFGGEVANEIGSKVVGQ